MRMTGWGALRERRRGGVRTDASGVRAACPKRGGAACARRRLAEACALVGAIAAAFALAGALGQAVPQIVRVAEGVGMAQSAAGGKLAGVFSEGAAEDFLEAAQAAGVDAVSASEAPAWFANEVLPASYTAAGAASGDWSVVGFSMPGDAESAFEQVHASLSERGWTGYESGTEGVATYTKEGGECSWLMVCCTCVGEETSVVLSVDRRAL